MTRTGEQAAVTAAAEPAAVPRRGRPRSEAAEQAIVGAVLSLLDQGYPLPLLSIEGIAAEAGVGKSTIYRRWSNKDELLFDVLLRVEAPEPEVGAGSVRDALVVALEYLRNAALAKRSQTSLTVLTTQLRAMPALYHRYHAEVIEPRRGRMRELLARGVAQGEIRGDVDLELLGDLFVGPMLACTVLRPGVPLDDPTLSARIVDTVLQGVAPAAPAAAPALAVRAAGPV